MLRIPHSLDSRLIDGSKVVSLTNWPFFTPKKHYFSASGTHFRGPFRIMTIFEELLAMLSITKLYIKIVFMNSIIIMNIRMVGRISLIFYYKHRISKLIRKVTVKILNLQETPFLTPFTTLIHFFCNFRVLLHPSSKNNILLQHGLKHCKIYSS
jgi:hypothetical protein